MSTRRVLVTGAAGTVGQVVCRLLKGRGHWVRGFDRVAMSDVDEQLVAQLADVSALQQAVDDVSAIIHLAAIPDAADFVDDLVPNNIVAPWRLLEAARSAGIERVVLASSIRVGFKHDWTTHTVTVAEGYAAHDAYSFSKVVCEEMGRLYAGVHGMTIIAARLGWVVRNPAEVERMVANEWKGEIALSQDDAARFFCACVENPLTFPTSLRFAALYATSRAVKRSAVDLSDAKSVIAWEPQDIWPHGSPWVELCRQLGFTPQDETT